MQGWMVGMAKIHSGSIMGEEKQSEMEGCNGEAERMWEAVLDLNKCGCVVEERDQGSVELVLATEF